MLILGETALSGRLRGTVFVLYWTICFMLTMVAIIVALRDLKALQQKVGREQRDLMEDTLSDIEREARDRRRG